MRDFRKLDLWKEGIEFSSIIYDLTAQFPKNEKYGLIDQMRRAVVSIPSNLAEGCSRKTNKEYVKYIDYSLGSAFELETQLIISSKVGYINQENAKNSIDRLSILQRRINVLRNSIL